MTKFKQGDRVVPSEFDQCGGLVFKKDMFTYVDVPGKILYLRENGPRYFVHGFWWPEEALRPARPKWEPKVGENAIFRDRQVIIHAINDIHV